MAPNTQSPDKNSGEPKANNKIQRVAPVVVNLGKAKRKRIKQLKRGEGKLMTEVAEALLKVEQDMAEQLAGKTVLPVVVIVEREREVRDSWAWWPMR